MAEHRNQELALNGNTLDNYYKLLGISPKASMDEVKDTYYSLAKEFHPDKQNIDEDCERSAIFTKIVQAYSVLSDPISRSLYDLAQGFTRDSLSERKRINNLKRRDVEEHYAAMATEAKESRAYEDSKEDGGLVILEALYGDISTNGSKIGNLVGKCIDVTVALQCIVSESSLVVLDGGSKSWLEGFYDPNDNQIENLLYVRYKFYNSLHECIVDDVEQLCLPLEDHLLPEAEQDAFAELDAEESDYSDSEDDDEASRLESQKRAKERKARKAALKSTLRTSVRIKPRQQVMNEMENMKSRRRRNLYTGVSIVCVSLGTYLAHRFGVINFFNLPPVRLLTDLTGMTTVTVNDNRRR